MLFPFIYLFLMNIKKYLLLSIFKIIKKFLLEYGWFTVLYFLLIN